MIEDGWAVSIGEFEDGDFRVLMRGLHDVGNGWELSPPVVAAGGPAVVEVPPGETGGTRKAHRPSEDRLTMTVEEAASALGISSAFAFEAVNSGDIPTIPIGRRILVPQGRLVPPARRGAPNVG